MGKIFKADSIDDEITQYEKGASHYQQGKSLPIFTNRIPTKSPTVVQRFSHCNNKLTFLFQTVYYASSTPSITILCPPPQKKSHNLRTSKVVNVNYANLNFFGLGSSATRTPLPPQGSSSSTTPNNPPTNSKS